MVMTMLVMMKILKIISAFATHLMVGIGLVYAYFWGRRNAKSKQVERAVENAEKARKVRTDVDRTVDPVERLHRDWSRD